MDLAIQRTRNQRDIQKLEKAICALDTPNWCSEPGKMLIIRRKKWQLRRVFVERRLHSLLGLLPDVGRTIAPPSHCRIRCNRPFQNAAPAPEPTACCTAFSRCGVSPGPEAAALAKRILGSGPLSFGGLKPSHASA